MDKRNKLWRREQQNRVFKARMVYHAACGCGIKKADGNWNRHPHWFELARVKWMQIYKKQERHAVVGCAEERSMIAGICKGNIADYSRSIDRFVCVTLKFSIVNMLNNLIFRAS